MTEIAEINPPLRGRLPDVSAPVSFVPMSDVSDTGEWVNRQTRLLREVGPGYTPFQEGDVLFAKITPCMENGKGMLAVGLANGLGFGSTEFHVLRAKPGGDPRYLHHLCQWELTRRRAESRMTGSAGQQRVQADFFAHFRVVRQSTEQQRRIADILDAADATIRYTEATIAKLRLMKDGLLRDLLTRGLDEHGRLGPSALTADERRCSRMTAIPDRWDVVPLVSVADIGSGVTLGRDVQGTSAVELPYLRVANVQDGYIDLTEVKTVRVYRSEVPGYLLQDGDVLMTEGGDFDKLGRGAVWRGEITPCLHQNHIFRVRTKRDRLLPDFLAMVSASHIGKAYFLRSSKQTTNLASINSTQLKAFPVPCPPIDEQRRIVEASSAMDGRLDSELSYLQKLKLQKRGLMHDLLTGRIPV